MPELPEVETIRRELDSALPGQRIVRVQFQDFAGVIGEMAPEAFTALVIDQSFGPVFRRGKNLRLQFGGGCGLLVHLMMTGQLLIMDRGAPSVRFEHLRFNLSNDTSLIFADQRKFGRVLFYDDQQWAELDRRLGVEPLSPAFTAGRLSEILHRRSAPVKNVLLDQIAVAGIGNIYADEALFEARVHPARPANTVMDAEVRRIHRALRAVLKASISNRGTTFSSYRDGLGEPGENQRLLRIYGKGRSDQPCPSCHGPLTCILVGGRSSHICPRCQTLP